LSGKYQGLEWAPPEAYGPRYEAARRQLEPELQLPALGPGASVVVTEGGTATGDFRGVGPGFVRFLEAGQPEMSIKTHRIVTLADALGHRVSGAVIEKLLATVGAYGVSHAFDSNSTSTCTDRGYAGRGRALGHLGRRVPRTHAPMS